MTENTNVNACLDEIQIQNSFNKNSNINYETIANCNTELLPKWEKVKTQETSSYGYIDKNNLVRLHGRYLGEVTKSTESLLFTLPIELRPNSTKIFPISSFSNWSSSQPYFATNRFFMTINTNGNVTLNTNHMNSGFTTVTIEIPFVDFQYNKNI